MYDRRRVFILLVLVVLLPLGTRTQVQDYNNAMRTCLTWAAIRISPYFVETAAQFLFCKSSDQVWGGSEEFMLR